MVMMTGPWMMRVLWWVFGGRYRSEGEGQLDGNQHRSRLVAVPQDINQQRMSSRDSWNAGRASPFRHDGSRLSSVSGRLTQVDVGEGEAEEAAEDVDDIEGADGTDMDGRGETVAG
jgi:hypothetical protein